MLQKETREGSRTTILFFERKKPYLTALVFLSFPFSLTVSSSIVFLEFSSDEGCSPVIVVVVEGEVYNKG